MFFEPLHDPDAEQVGVGEAFELIVQESVDDEPEVIVVELPVNVRLGATDDGLDGEGLGDGLGVGVGVGDGDGLGDGVGDGLDVGLEDGEADGEELGDDDGVGLVCVLFVVVTDF